MVGRRGLAEESWQGIGPRLDEDVQTPEALPLQREGGQPTPPYDNLLLSGRLCFGPFGVFQWTYVNKADTLLGPQSRTKSG